MTGYVPPDLPGLEFEHFADRVGQSFPANTSDGERVELILLEARDRKRAPHLAPGFSLEFRMAPEESSPHQQMLELEHPQEGAHMIFVVPVGRDDHGTIYQAVFSFLPDTDA